MKAESVAASGRGAPQELAPTGFYSAREYVGEYLENKSKASDLLSKAIDKASRRQGDLGEVWHGLMLLFRFLRAWITGGYRDVGVQTMVLVFTAILYFILPLDAIPDFTPIMGFMDDVTIILFVLNRVKAELSEFEDWEKIHQVD